METKKSKTGAMIGTAAAVFLCGCPGLFFCIMGAFAVAGKMPFETTLNGITNTGMLPSWAGYGFLCLSLVLIAIPIVVGFMTLRDKKPKDVVPSFDEPLPPAS